MRARTAGLRDQLQLRQLVDQVPGDPGAFADQHQGLRIREAHAELSGALDGVVEHLDVVLGEQREAVELADGVLIVVEDRNLHQGGFRGPRNGARTM